MIPESVYSLKTQKKSEKFKSKTAKYLAITKEQNEIRQTPSIQNKAGLGANNLY